ncbi:MAG: formate--tetrahydrofolate ligase [Patescibacteria group bacterium]|jgi:formate--tetrahydrofolate ligase
MKKIISVAKKIGIPENSLESQGDYIAKIKMPLKKKVGKRKVGKLILFTAITPTRFGEGKTTMSIGMADALNRLGKKVILALREPSLGPVFSQKGGAIGGGKAKVVPSEEINLHFTGDFHAVTAVHNLIAAEIDNSVHWSNPLDVKEIYWKRSMDLCDRSLRKEFNITAASEIMAILCLANDLKDLSRRLESIVIGVNGQGRPIKVKDLKIIDNLIALMKRAILPNLAQTNEGAPAIIHGGPFANIAHGANSLIATRTALSLADYVVTEAGFGSDLGGLKFFDIVSRLGKLKPAAVVLVATNRALKECGMDNLGRHIEIIRRLGVEPIVVINKFNDDTEKDVNEIKKYCESQNASCEVSLAFAQGGKGSLKLAKMVLKKIDSFGAKSPALRPLYSLSEGIKEKVEIINSEIFGGACVLFSPLAKAKIEQYVKWGYGQLPVCVAKTQYSLSDDKAQPRITGGFTLKVTDARLSAGAGFIVIQCGGILTMPGMPDKKI